jgi:hypothetical protein
MDDQDVRAIMRAIVHYHKKHVPQYDQFAYQFNVGDEKEIAENLFNFCKANVAYSIQDKERQTVRSPARTLSESYGDCKHYASFIAGVIDALKRSGLDLDWAYRFSKYVDLAGNVTNHVFVVLYPREGREIWIDPVLNWFDYHLPYRSAITQTVDTMDQAAAMGCCGDHTMGAVGDLVSTDRRLPVPAGYPTNLPFPVLTADGQLVLRNNWHLLLENERAWIQKALQPLIIQYSKTPYNIYWSIKGWGSGSGDILFASTPLFGTANRNRNWLLYPKMPSGLDKLEMGINNILPSLIGTAANAVVPGSGGIASSIVSSQTSSPGGNNAVDLTAAQIQALQQQQQPTNTFSAGISLGPLLLLIGAGLYIFSNNKR